jgi:ABC-type transporter Mla MlaB component
MNETGPTQAIFAPDGPLTVRTIATVRSTLLEFLAAHPSVQVDCTAATSVDLSFIQLLLAARQSAQTVGKELKLIVPPGSTMHAALEQGGFLPPVGADPFWSGEA